jgi:hypothetical protein
MISLRKVERLNSCSTPGANAPQMRDFFMHLIQNRTANARFRYNPHIFIIHNFLSINML